MRGSSQKNGQMGNVLFTSFPVSGQQPAPLSIALREMEREKREKKWGVQSTGERDHELRRYRKKMPQNARRKGGKIGQMERKGGWW